MAEVIKTMWRWESYSDKPTPLQVVKETEHFITHKYLAWDGKTWLESRVAKAGLHNSFAEAKAAKLHMLQQQIENAKDRIRDAEKDIVRIVRMEKP